MKYRIGLLATLSALTVLALTPKAQAQTTFASFAQIGNDPTFRFKNDGLTNNPSQIQFLSQLQSEPAGSFVTSAIPVNFFYSVPNGYASLNGLTTDPIAATLTLTSQAAGNSIVGGGLALQQLQAISITITANTPVNGLSNLLTMSLSTGKLFGTDGGAAATLQGSEVSGDTVTFSSDFVNTDGQNSYNISITGANPNFSQGSNNFIQAFDANATGSFTASVVIPEPASILFFSALPILGIVRRKRNKS